MMLVKVDMVFEKNGTGKLWPEVRTPLWEAIEKIKKEHGCKVAITVTEGKRISAMHM